MRDPLDHATPSGPTRTVCLLPPATSPSFPGRYASEYSVSFSVFGSHLPSLFTPTPPQPHRAVRGRVGGMNGDRLFIGDVVFLHYPSFGVEFPDLVGAS